MNLNFECADPRPRSLGHKMLIDFIASGAEYCEVETDTPRSTYSSLSQIRTRNRKEYGEIEVVLRYGKVYLIRKEGA